MPIYKGKGETNEPESYRPISMCSCFGKLLEKLIKKQLETHIAEHFPLHRAQHGFAGCRSTTTNLLVSDSIIADCISHRRPYDVIALDFQKAFDKIPHSVIMSELQSRGVAGKALQWFHSYLSDRTQFVRFHKRLKFSQCVIWGDSRICSRSATFQCRHGFSSEAVAATIARVRRRF